MPKSKPDPWHFARPELAQRYLQTFQIGLISAVAPARARGVNDARTAGVQGKVDRWLTRMRRTLVCPGVAHSLSRRRLNWAWNAPDLRLKDLKESGGAHPTCSTHGYNTVSDAAAVTFNQQVNHHSSSGHAVGMAQGDRAPVNIEAIIWNV